MSNTILGTLPNSVNRPPLSKVTEYNRRLKEDIKLHPDTAEWIKGTDNIELEFQTRYFKQKQEEAKQFIN